VRSVHGLIPAPGIAALDVGGSSVKSGVVAPDGALAGPLSLAPLDSDASAAELLGTLAGVARTQLDREDALDDVLAVAYPGPCDYAAGVAQSTVKLAALNGLSLAAELRARTGRPELDVSFRNDAEAAAAAEARVGAGRTFARVLMLTLGTGLGAAFVERGEPIAERAGIVAAELYRLPVGESTADDRFSTRGLATRLRELGAPATDLAEAAALAEQSASTLDAFSGFGQDLGRFLAPRLEALDAQALVIGGGLAGAFRLFGPAVAAEVHVPVIPAGLGRAAGVIGAALCLAPALGATPT
jgi:glucokinase